MMRRTAALSRGWAALALVLACSVLVGVVRIGPAVAVDEGRFVTSCAASHRAHDDPIVFPSMSGVSHSHDFYGNPATDENSTYRSLIDAAETTCERVDDLAAYWVPTLFQDGVAQLAPAVRAYYRVADRDPVAIRAYPPGLRVIAGRAAAETPQPLRKASWACSVSGDEVPEREVPDCGADSATRLRIGFPDCWDGRRLDSRNHKSHMKYAQDDGCPASHPVPVPMLALAFRWRLDDNTGLALACGNIYCGHADFVNAWDQDLLEELVERCIRVDVDCGDDEGPGAIQDVSYHFPDGIPSEPSSGTAAPPPWRALCDPARATIVGTEGPDVIVGTSGPDVILALGGRDRIYGLGGDDIICGGSGADVIDGGDGDDQVRGERGMDRIVGGAGNDWLHGGGGADRINGNEGYDILIGAQKADELHGNGSGDTLNGGEGNDVLVGGAGPDALLGGGGDDLMEGRGGSDLLLGGPGDDGFAGGAGRDACYELVASGDVVAC